MVAEMIEVCDWNEVPRFTNEEDEHDFWSTHCLAESLIVSPGGRRDPNIPFRPTHPRRDPIELALDPDVSRRLHDLAPKKGADDYSLLISFINERLYEEEKREGLVG